MSEQDQQSDAFSLTYTNTLIIIACEALQDELQIYLYYCDLIARVRWFTLSPTNRRLPGSPPLSERLRAVSESVTFVYGLATYKTRPNTGPCQVSQCVYSQSSDKQWA